MARKTKGEPTRLNLWVLAEFFKDADERPAKVAPTEYAHLKRCFKAGLCEVVGGVIRLTEAGKAAVNRKDGA
jgi:hypothetical protein